MSSIRRKRSNLATFGVSHVNVVEVLLQRRSGAPLPARN